MNEATREFIRQHRDDDIRVLALRGTKDPEVDLGGTANLESCAKADVIHFNGFSIPSRKIFHEA